MSWKPASSNPMKYRRIIPGPAGEWMRLQLNKNKNKSENGEGDIKEQNDKVEKLLNASHLVKNGKLSTNEIPLYDIDLLTNPYLNALYDNHFILYMNDNNKNNRNTLFMRPLNKNNNDCFILSNNIAMIKNQIEHVFKVDELLVLLCNLTIYQDGIGLVIDPFGSMQVTFTGKVLKENPDIQIGVALILKDVTIYQPIPHKYYLNVTSENIIKIYQNPMERVKSFSDVICKYLKSLGRNAPSNLYQDDNINDKKKKRSKDKKKDDDNNNDNDYYDKGIKFYEENKRKRRRSLSLKKRKYSDFSSIADNPYLVQPEELENDRNYINQPKRKRQRLNLNDDYNENEKEKEKEQEREQEQEKERKQKEEEEKEKERERQRKIQKVMNIAMDVFNSSPHPSDDEIIQKSMAECGVTPGGPMQEKSKSRINDNDDDDNDSDNMNDDEDEQKMIVEDKKDDKETPKGNHRKHQRRFNFNVSSSKKKKKDKQKKKAQEIEKEKEIERKKEIEKQKMKKKLESNDKLNICNTSQRQENLPKDTDCMEDLFSQMEDGFFDGDEF